MKQKQESDSLTTMAQLRDEVRQFVEERNWKQYHSPKNLGMSIAIEAAEIMEHFQWVSHEKSLDLVKGGETKDMVADELADVIIYCLCLANQADIDVTEAVKSKLERSQERYPIGYMPNKE